MKESELLQELNAKYFRLGAPQNAETSEKGRKIRQAEGIEWFVVGVYEQAGESLIRKNVAYYVVNKGKSTERAFYAEPQKTTKELEVKESVWTPDTLLSAQSYAGYQVETVNTTQKWAIATVFFAEDRAVKQKRVFVTETEILDFGV